MSPQAVGKGEGVAPEAPESHVRRPGLGEIVSAVVRDGVPLVGVFLLGWQAVSVIALFWLDGFLCLLSMVPAILRSSEAEDPKMYADFPGGSRVMARSAYLAIFVAFMAFVSGVPGIFIWVSLGRALGDPLGILLASRGTVTAAAVMALTYAVQGVVTYRSILRPDLKLQTRVSGSMAIYRTAIAGALSLFVVGGWTLKIFTLLLCGISVAFELNPQVFERLVKEADAKEPPKGR